MNTENIIDLQKRFEELVSVVEIMEKTVNALKINDQRRLDANAIIPPGIACKVSYDKNGLIIKGGKLEDSDIPQLDIDKINGLRKAINDKASIKDLEKFKVTMEEMIRPAVQSFNEVVGTGVKVNYNSEGRIISTADLLPSDIPSLPITKIEGLSDVIDDLKTQLMSKDNDDESTNQVMMRNRSGGTFVKVTVDNYGRIISGDDTFGINDIPIEIINRINDIQSKLIEFASQRTVEGISQMVINKVDANTPIIPGTYTKFRVDSKGLIVHGEKLTVKDLPELSISDIKGLDKIITDKADQKDLISLHDTVSSLVNSFSKIGEITGIKNELQHKASNDELQQIVSKVNSIKSSLDLLMNRMPSDMIVEQLNQISSAMSCLDGRISVIENHLGIK